jgi:DNA-binding NarL/FixJ family response regulator
MGTRAAMRIVIAEDHEMFREVIRRVCIDDFGCAVVGEAADGPAAIRMVLAAEPELLLLDLNLPAIDGFGVIDVLRRAHSAVRVIALTSARGDYTVFRVERAGFHGFVDKGGNSLANLRAAIEAVAAGRRYFSSAFVQAAAARRADPISFDKVLSERERAVLGLIGGSLSDEEIARQLSIHPKTAETHRQRIMDKLNIHGTPKLIRFAIEQGFTQVAVKGDAGGSAFP